VSTAQLDWLAGPASCMHAGEFLTREFLAPGWKPGSPDAGFARSKYRHWLVDEHGSKVAMQNRNPTATDIAYAILRGRGLTYWRSNGRDDFDTIQTAKRYGMLPARIDVAIDTTHPKITPETFQRLWRDGRISSRMTERRDYMGEGCSFYLGSHNRLVRVYDKTAERARAGEAIAPGTTRIELEMRGSYAKRFWKRLAAIPAGNWQAQFPQLVGQAIIAAMRPLERPQTEANPQRIPTWQPFAAELGESKPLKLDQAKRQARFNRQGTLVSVFGTTDRMAAPLSAFLDLLDKVPAVERERIRAALRNRQQPQHRDVVEAIDGPAELRAMLADVHPDLLPAWSRNLKAGDQ
jgi:hypothetical protein